MHESIALVSSDEQEFELEVEACMKSDMINFILDDCNADTVIPLPNVKDKTLAKIMKKHAGEEQVADEEELSAWDGEFTKVDTGTLYFLLNDGVETVDLCVETVANLMRGKMPAEIREIFNIKNDFTAQEEAEMMKEDGWALGEE